MDIAKFKADSIFVPTIRGMQAFVPNALPPDIRLDTIVSEFGEATLALGKLNGIGNTIANPYMVIRPLQKNEALRSSAMEGTFSTADDLALIETLDESATDDSAREVFNYVKAIDYAIEQLKALPISHRIIRGMHAMLLGNSTKAHGRDKRTGTYKIHQNWIGARQIQNARFIPPPPEQAQACMDDLEKFINTPPHAMSVPPLIAAGLCHYQFEAIHPFSDGNGRVGRMLITLQLLDNGLLDRPLLYVSPYIEAHKDEYIDAMFAVSTKGDWTRWLRFFLTAIKESCVETTKTIAKLNALQEKYRDLLHEKSQSVSALLMADHLFERPVVSIPAVAEKCDITYAAAKNTVETLARLGIVKQVPNINKPKLYWAKEIIDISDE